MQSRPLRRRPPRRRNLLPLLQSIQHCPIGPWLAQPSTTEQSPKQIPCRCSNASTFFLHPFEGYVWFLWIGAAGKMAVTLAPNTPAHGNTLQVRGDKSGDGRCAPGAMQREGIAWRCVLRQRRIPGNDLRRADKVKPGSRQRRHVQRLADVAGGIGPIRMFVEERAARRKIEQRGASQQRQRVAHNRSPENGYAPVHKRHLSLTL